MMTGLLLLPVLGICTWLYWYFLPGRTWQRADTLTLITVIALAAAFVVRIEKMDWTGSSPMWSQIVSVAGAYAILILGLSAGLYLRRR
jgi:hypothetical protein